MPKLIHAVPKYRKHKASGQAVVTIAGKDHYLGPHGTAVSKREYDRLIGEFLARGRRDTQSTERQIEVVEILSAYWSFAQGYYVKNGRTTNEVDAIKLVIRDTRQLYGRTPAIDFGPLALKTVRQEWIDRGQSRPTVNKNMRRLTRIFRWAVAEEMIPGTVLHALTAVPGLKKGRCDLPEPPPIMPVPLHVVEATLPHMPQVTADMVRFQLLTGTRPGEVCQLTPDAIDRSHEIWEYHVAAHKTQHYGRDRTVFVGPEAQAVLTPYLQRSGGSVCFSMAESLEQRRQARNDARVTPPSCGNRRGRRYRSDRLRRSDRRRRAREAFDTGSYRHAIHSACDHAFPAPDPIGRRDKESDAARLRRLTEALRAELKKWQKDHRWHPNQLRHTRATEIRKRFGLEGAQVILGHAAADVTQVYAERDADKAREIAMKIG